ncbi:MAG: glycosyltransferase family 2 protein [Pseudomonadota bacterium]|nr:glycosyltransferase family 2 protein [Pseudomonadota bacterium]
MTIPLGFRPRSDRVRLRMAEILREAPPVVALGFEDDGWTAACLRIGGHTPVWASPADPAPCAALLAHLGLPGLGAGPAGATLRADLSWATVDPTVRAPAPAPVAPAATRPGGPLVTILICTFNRATLLPRAIASARAQSWPCEVLVVDDGSTDDTPTVLGTIPGIRSLRQAPNRGKPAALALGLAEARGEAILVLDDDDLLLPDAVRVLATALFANPTLAAVWGDTVVFDGKTGAPTAVRPACRLPAAMVPLAVLQQVPAQPGATLVRASAWRAAGPLDPSLVRGQDMDLYLALSQVGPIEAVPLPVLAYRSHSGLRGAEGAQWDKHDRKTHDARFRSFVKPVFARRYAEASPVPDRATGHAWALGLYQRDLPEEAHRELARWAGPYTPAEAWARTTAGLPTEARQPDRTLVVVDDGDEGALEATLALHARGHTVLVDLEVPRDPLGNVKLYWPGTYAAQTRLHTWHVRPGDWRLALTSAPGWTPPPLDDPGWLPDLPAPEALLAVAAALGWAPPLRSRPGLATIHGPTSRRAWAVRRALDLHCPKDALGPLGELVSTMPSWRGAWRLAAETFAALGHPTEANACHVRARGRGGVGSEGMFVS